MTLTREELLAKLKAAGIKVVIVDYNGSGDEGFVDEISADGMPIESQAQLKEEIEHWVYKALEPLPDWYNNEGGGGTLTINVEAGTVQTDHYTNETHENHEDYTL